VTNTAPATISVGDGAFVTVGQVLVGKYRVERLLGEGGMGVVLAVHHLALGQTFALKVLSPGKAITEEHRVRFAREARAAARLAGPHVVRVVDSGELSEAPFDKTPFLVMEFAAGKDLAEVLDEAMTLPVETAVRYTLQACEALAEAHARGLVHRDLKPSNLLLGEASDGTPLVKLLDFGISKLAEEFEPALTTSQAVMGTPRYMAPEQMRSAKDVDPRSDLWALGVILYEMLAGVTPFDGSTLVELVLAVQQQAPMPLSEVAVGVPDGLVMVVHRLLNKDPEGRFPNVGALAAALAPFSPEDELPRIPRIQRMLARAAAPSERQIPASPSSGTLPVEDPSGPAASGPSTDPHAISFPDRPRGATAVGIPSLVRDSQDDRTGDARTANVIHEEVRKALPQAAAPSPTGNAGLDDEVTLPVASSRLPLVAVAVLFVGGLGYGAYRIQNTEVTAPPSPSAVPSSSSSGNLSNSLSSLPPTLGSAPGPLAPSAKAIASASARPPVKGPAVPGPLAGPKPAKSATPPETGDPNDPNGLLGQH
jgi:serine/threonine-protein kinase